MKVRISGFDQDCELFPGDLQELVIEEPCLLYRTIGAFAYADEDSIAVFESDKELSLEKSVLVITDPFLLDPNSKKALGQLYKNAALHHFNDERREQWAQIQKDIVSFMEELSLDYDAPTAYADSIPFEKFLSSLDFRYRLDGESFFQRLLTFIKASLESGSYKLIVGYELANLLSGAEIALLKDELSQMGLALLSFCGKKERCIEEKHNFSTVDDDYCSF